MKRILFVITLLLLLLVTFTVATAEVPAPGGPFSTAFNIQNLSDSTATCVIQFYDSAGDIGLTLDPPPIPANDVAEFFTGTADFDSLLPGQYSAVVSCDQPVAAVVNFSDSNRGASHSGLGSAEIGTNWFAPALYNNYYNYYSNIVVQNATASAIDITVNVYEAGNASPVSTYLAEDVPAFASVSFDQSTDSNLSKNVSYSATIDGTGEVAAIVNIYGTGPVNDQLYSYNLFASGSVEAFAPIIMSNFYGYNTSLTVQNTDDADTAEVTVEYNNGNTQSVSIGPGASHAFLNFLDTNVLPPGNFTYSAKIVSTNNVPIVGLVNQSDSLNRAASYSAFPGGKTLTTAPIVFKSYYGYDSSLTCQNLGTSTTDITVNYAGVQTDSLMEDVDPGDVGQIIQLYDPTLSSVSNNWNSSATMTATEPIVCVVNYNMIVGPGASVVQDQLFSYNGILP